MRADAAEWYESRTSHASDWPADALARAKAGTSVSVVLPALNEERTVGSIVSVFSRLAHESGLVDEIVVMDSGSTDSTRHVAAAAGAVVHHRDDVLPELGSRPGKGEVLWKSLAVTTGDIVVFCDSDLEDVGAEYVTGLLGPLLTDSGTSFVKACYDRPLRGSRGPEDGEPGEATGWPEEPLVHDQAGGRVTELVARPLLNLCFPALSGFVQPLGGEYAGRRELLEALSFASGYGVDIALLIDTWKAVGLPGMAQVDLDTRVHRHQAQRALGRMAAQVMQAVLARTAAPDESAGETRSQLVPLSEEITQFHRASGRFVAESYPVAVTERPPMSTVPYPRGHS